MPIMAKQGSLYHFSVGNIVELLQYLASVVCKIYFAKTQLFEICHTRLKYMLVLLAVDV